MLFIRRPRFQKDFDRLPRRIQEKVIERLSLFEVDQFNPLLNNHKLRYSYAEYRSINVTGDIRIIYTVEDRDKYFLVRIGTHSELFGL